MSYAWVFQRWLSQAAVYLSIWWPVMFGNGGGREHIIAERIEYRPAPSG